MAHYPGEGTEPCLGKRRDGMPCGNREVDGLEFCLHHIPDDMLAEAEEITGMRRCRQRFGEDDACRYLAVAGTEPPMCKVHGANIGSYQSQLAARREISGEVANRMAAILAEHGERLLEVQPVVNPLLALQQLAGEVLAFKDILRLAVARLEQAMWRYAGTRTGEQVRAEILLYGQALDRSERILVNIAKLRIEEVLARISAAQVDKIERAMVLALEASGADIEGQERARQVLARELA